MYWYVPMRRRVCYAYGVNIGSRRMFYILLRFAVWYSGKWYGWFVQSFRFCLAGLALYAYLPMFVRIFRSVCIFKYFYSHTVGIWTTRMNRVRGCKPVKVNDSRNTRHVVRLGLMFFIMTCDVINIKAVISVFCLFEYMYV